MVRKRERSVKWIIQDRNVILGIWLRDSTLVFGGPVSQRTSHEVILDKLLGWPLNSVSKVHLSGGRYRAICKLPGESILTRVVRNLDYHGKRITSFRRLMH